MADRGTMEVGNGMTPQASPPGLQLVLDAPARGGVGVMVGSAYNQASRNFIETEILVNFDQILVDTPIGTEGMDGSAA